MSNQFDKFETENLTLLDLVKIEEILKTVMQENFKPQGIDEFTDYCKSCSVPVKDAYYVPTLEDIYEQLQPAIAIRQGQVSQLNRMYAKGFKK